MGRTRHLLAAAIAAALALTGAAVAPPAAAANAAGAGTVDIEHFTVGPGGSFGPATLTGTIAIGGRVFAGTIRTGTAAVDDKGFGEFAPWDIAPFTLTGVGPLGGLTGTCSQTLFFGFKLDCEARIAGGPSGTFVMELGTVGLPPARYIGTYTVESAP